MKHFQRGILASLTVAALSVVASIAPMSAQASSMPVSIPADGAAVGLNLHYRAGTIATTQRFNISAQLANLGIHVTSDRPLGTGWHALTFQAPTTTDQALLALKLATANPAVISGGIDRFTRSAAALNHTPSQLAAPSVATTAAPRGGAYVGTTKTAAFKPASAPASVTVNDGFSAADPNTAAVTAKWKKPVLLNGGTISGYQAQASFDGGKTISNQLISLTPSQTRTTINNGLTAGAPVSIRVAAITKYRGVSKVGAYSAWKSATPTTLPVAPTFSTLALASATQKPSWLAYSLADAGGLPVTFTATASAAGQTDVVCKSTTTTCNFAGLTPGITYTVKVFASNIHGSSKAVGAFQVTDPLYKQQWALNSKYGINIESAWQHTHGTSNVTVAVLDSGISAHPDLDSQVWRNTDGTVYGYNFVTKTSDPTGPGCSANPTDPNSANEWHGTHVSGIIAAAANDQGIVGVAPGVKLLEVKVMGSNGGSSADLIAGLNWASGRDIPTSNACGVIAKNLHPAQVMNLSLGNANGSCDTGTTSVLGAIKDMGITVVTAAGNDSYEAAISYPGNCFPTINVAASTYDGKIASYSNFGVGVDIAAPGGDQTVPADLPVGDTSGILSTWNTGGENLASNAPPALAATPTYKDEMGTSMAAPMVAGVVALLYSVKPNINFDQVWHALSDTGNYTPFPAVKSVLNNGNLSVDCSTAVPNTRTGCGIGIVNAGAAVDAASKMN